MSISIDVRCSDCGESYDVQEESADDHAEDCPIRSAMISAGRWEKP